MDVRYINPFLTAITKVFSTMLNTTPERSQLRKGGSENMDPELLTGVISLSGEIQGVIAIALPPKTAQCAAARILNQEIASISADSLNSMVGELVNMIAGVAKAELNYNPPLNLGLPMVVTGNQYRLKFPVTSQCIEIPMTSELGDMSMEVTIAEAK